jgi:diacylglycerol kinase (ATP)
MRIKIIHNPYSARWNSGKYHQKIIDFFDNLNCDYEISKTKFDGHGIELAKKATEDGFDIIVAAGGDGTIGNVLNGIKSANHDGEQPVLGLLPLGTANDLAHNLDNPLALKEACELIITGKPKLIDIGKVNQRYFINNSGLGLEPFVTVQQEKIKIFGGLLRYAIATIIAIIKNPQWHMSLEWDDGSYEGPVTLISVNNCPLTGGLFYTAPDASPYDGKLTFSYGYVPTKLKIIALLPRLMQQGERSYVHHPAVHQVNTTSLRVKIKPTSPAHGDGELFSRNISEVEYTIFPNAIKVITPD